MSVSRVTILDFDMLERLGKRVREAWVAWAKRQPDPKPSWLVPWDELSEADKDADRCIAAALWGEFNTVCHECGGSGVVDSGGFREDGMSIDVPCECQGERRELQGLLSQCRTDLFHWAALAEKQRAELPNVNHLPCGPTTSGIAVTRRLIELIDETFKESLPCPQWPPVPKP